jgi:hypothetical protein
MTAAEPPSAQAQTGHGNSFNEPGALWAILIIMWPYFWAILIIMWPYYKHLYYPSRRIAYKCQRSNIRKMD